MGWDGRAANNGSAQVLINWVDEEMLRTSTGVEASSNPQQNEAGDFWIGDATPAEKNTLLQHRRAAGSLSPSLRIAVGDREGMIQEHMQAWDLRGRNFYAGKSRGKMPGVLIVEQRE